MHGGGLVVGRVFVAKNLFYVKLATVVESNAKAPFLMATTPMSTGGRYSISWIRTL